VGFPPRLAIATRNPGKVREILQICEDWPVQWITYEDASWPEVEETGRSYLENALLKARAVTRALGVPAIADDSGIEADALGGAPGTRSARFAGPGATDEQNLRLLLDRVAARPEAPRTARYTCVAACAWPDGLEVWAEGTCEGTLIPEPRGSGGFGYDPAFRPSGETRSMAELPPREKNAISHRGRAFRGLRDAVSNADA
jgi:XTP/dITP diphosphohydrolase